MKVNAYQSDVIAPMFQNAKLNLPLASQVLLGKQQQFDQAYQAMQNLKKDSLNIKFLNKESQKKIDDYNTQIATDFPDVSKGNVDLSSANITSSYMKNFQAIANDTELIQNYKKDKQVQQSLQDLTTRKNSKDPMKAGYHPMNEANFMNEVQAYMDATGDLSNYKASYTPYTDTSKEMAALTKTIPKDKSETFQITKDGMGKIKITTVGKKPSSVRAASSQYYNGRGSGQMRESAKYAYSQIKNNDAKKQEVQANYYDVISREIESTEEQIDALKERKPKTDQEAMQIAQKQANLEQVLGQLENKQDQLLDPANFEDDAQWTNWMTDLYTHQAIENDVLAYGQQSVSYEYEENPVYVNAKNWEMELMNIGIKQQGADLKEREFQYEMIKDAKEATEASSSGAVPTTAQGIESVGNAAGGSYGKSSKADLAQLDGFVDGIYEHLDDIQYKTQNPFKTGVSGEIEMTKTEQIEYDKQTAVITELEKKGTGTHKEPITDLLHNKYTESTRSGSKSKNVPIKDLSKLGEVIQSKIETIAGLIERTTTPQKIEYMDKYVSLKKFPSVMKKYDLTSLRAIQNDLIKNTPASKEVTDKVEIISKLMEQAELEAQLVDFQNASTSEDQLNKKAKVVELKSQLETYKGDLEIFNSYGTGYDVDNKLSDQDNKKIADLKAKRDKITNITQLSGDQMLAIVLDKKEWDKFKQNDYLADNVYIRAAREVIEDNNYKEMSKEDLKIATDKLMKDESSKFYGELVAEQRKKAHHNHFFGTVTDPKDIKVMMNNYQSVSFYTPYVIDMTDKSSGKEQTKARQQIKNSALRSLEAQIVGGDDRIGTGGIPLDAVVGYRLYKGNVEVTIDPTKMMDYDKEEKTKWTYRIGDGEDITLDVTNNVIKFYDESLDKDLSSNLMFGIPTGEEMMYADYSSIKGRKYSLMTEDNQYYTIVLYENGQEYKRIKNKKVPAEALMQAGDKWSKGGELSF